MSARSHWLVAGTVLLVGLGLTAWLVHYQTQANGKVVQQRFEHEAGAATDAIRARVTAYSDLVAGVRDLYLATPDMGHRRFERILSGRQLRERYPEIRNISFARFATTDQLPALEQSLQAQAEDLQTPTSGAIIHPRLPGPDHYVIQYLWPRERNSGVFGLDIGSQPANVAALLRARRTGQPVLSAPFDLLQETVQRQAFMLRYPVFVPDGAAAGPPRFIGAVAAAVRTHEMLEAIRAAGSLRGVALRLDDIGAADAAVPGPAQLLGAAGAAASEPDVHAARLVRTLDLYGRRWQLSFAALTPLISPSERLLPAWMAAAGATLSLLAALAAGWLMRQRTQALRVMQTAHGALHDREQRLRAIFHQAAVGVALVDIRSGRLVDANQKCCAMLGYTRAELLERDTRAISDPADQSTEGELVRRLLDQEIPSGHLEKRLCGKDGRAIWVDLTISPILQPGKPLTQAMYVMQDITQRREVDEALQRSERRQRTMLDHLPIGIILASIADRIEYRNAAYLRITGYTPDVVYDSGSWFQHAYPDPHQRAQAMQQWGMLRDKALAGNGIMQEHEYFIQCADGAQRTVAISGVLMEGMEMVLIEDLTDRKAAQTEISYLASFDPLTGLANRRQLLARLADAMQRCARNEGCGAVLMLDLDHFKTLNETRGHECGDELLRLVAQRLQVFVQGQDTLARHGDDAFVLVLEAAGSSIDAMAAHASDVGRRILEVLRQPFMLDGEPYHTSASIGAALFRGQEESVDDLLQQVDMALYQAKAAGRDTLCFYDADVQARVHARAQLERDLRTALAENQFELYYQAQVCDGRVLGAEALVRWHHPQAGFVSPGQFIPLAEESGLILPLGQWVLESACRQLVRWAADPRLAPLKLAVNVSPRQFSQPDFTDQVLAALASTGANPQRLELELTEGLLLQDVEGTISKMAALKAYGVGFSLDDFGTGYSSLSYLKRLPLDKLKIDQSFVRDVLVDPNDAAIARTIVALGASLGLRTVAEGVETEAQRAFLQRSGCDTWQGYLFGKPVAGPAFEASVGELQGLGVASP